MNETPSSDHELLERIAAGDENAFTTFYRRYQNRIYRFALQMSGRTNTAEEVTQEVFMAIIQQTGRWNPERGGVPAYLYGIARNHVLRCLERDRRYVAIDFGERESESVDEDRSRTIDPLWDLTREERGETVRRAVSTLPPIYREVIVLCELQELSYQEAAAAAGCAVGTIRSRLHRARELLLKKLSREPAARSVLVSSFPGRP
jgi:RNA polymerase sigma-70 factor (ECF subfamily)